MPRASHPRLPCRPFTLPSLPLLIRIEADSRSPPQTLTLAAIAAAASSARRCRRRFAVAGERRLDSLRGELHLPPRDPFPSSLGPLFLPFLQGPRRAPPPAAASLRRDAASSPLLACITAGEARLPPLHAVRARPEPLRPRPAAPPSVGAAACARRARGRAQARGQGSPWP